MSEQGSSRRDRIDALLLLVAVVVGAVLRFVWLDDMEYKLDEAWTFLRTRSSLAEALTQLGMPSSKNVLNPGMSVWLFVVIAKIAGAADPVELVRAIQVSNVAALALLAAFVLKCVPLREREPWIWATALAAVNPLAVMFQRKIWPPSALPLPLVVLLIAWWHRDRRWAAFLWGAIGACIGQVHMPGFIMVGGVVAATFIYDRARVAWRYWLLGSFLGALPLAGWLAYMATTRSSTPRGTFAWHRLFEFKFFTHWITEPLGYGLKYSLGDGWDHFLRSPYIGDRPTYLVLILHGAVLAGAVLIAMSAIQRWRYRSESNSPTRFAVNATFLGYGLLFTASCLPYYRHYTLVAFPFTFLWLGWIGSSSPEGRRTGRVGLGVLVAAQLMITTQFLSHIHTHNGAPLGDYGIAYRSPDNPVNGLIRTSGTRAITGIPTSR